MRKTTFLIFVFLLISSFYVSAEYKYNPLVWKGLDYYEAGTGGVAWNLTGSNYLYNCTGSLCWNESKGNNTYLLRVNEGSLDVNSSDYWDSYDAPSDIQDLLVIPCGNISGATSDLCTITDTTIGNCSVPGSCGSLAYLDYANQGNLNISGYYAGQPLDGSIGSGVIWSGDIDSEGNVNLSINSLNITYPDMVVRLARTDNLVKYCNITSDTITLSENSHLVFYVDNTCTVKNTSFNNYITTALSPGGIADIFNAYAVNGSVEMSKGATVKNKETIKTRKVIFRTAHLRVHSGMNLDFNTVFPELYQYSGEYLYVKTLVNTLARNSSVNGIRLVSHINGTWGYVEQTGINLTHCDNTTDLIQCPTNKYRRYVIYTIGEENTTRLYQLAPLTTDTTYNNVGDCLDLVDNPISYTLPSMHEYLAVPTYVYCGLRDANSWDDAWIDIRGGVVTHGAMPDLGNYLSYDGLTQNWNQGDYNLTSTNSWFLGKINWSNIQNKLITSVNDVYLYLSSSTLFFNESKLNNTIRSFNSSWDYTVDTVWGLGDDYLYNCTGSLCLNESLLNSTIDSRDSDTTYSAGSYLYLSGTEFNVNETELNSTIDARDTDTNTWWGIDLADFINNSNTLELNWTTINSTIDARDDDTTYGCSDWAGCSDDSLWDADKLDGQDGSYYLDDTTIGNCSVSNSCSNILYESELDTFSELNNQIGDATLLNKSFADNTYLDNTDSQTLSFSGDNISISGGNEINISSIDTTIGNCSVDQSCPNILYDAGDTASGNYTFGGALFIDDTNNRVGVNTTTPVSTFEIIGDLTIGDGYNDTADVWSNSSYLLFDAQTDDGDTGGYIREEAHPEWEGLYLMLGGYLDEGSGREFYPGMAIEARGDFIILLSDYISFDSLTDCDTIDTDEYGFLSCGTDADTHLSEDQVEAYVFDDDNTDNFNLSTYNISTVHCIVFDNGGKIGNCG